MHCKINWSRFAAERCTICGRSVSCEGMPMPEDCSVPENITSDARDLPVISQWLTPAYKDRMTVIREQVERFIGQHDQGETVMRHFTPHGKDHCAAVENNLYRLIPGKLFVRLSEHERFYLVASAWLHDLGMYIEGLEDCHLSGPELRQQHHINSQRILVKDFKLLGLLPWEVDIFSTLARFHRQQEDIYQCPEVMTTFSISLRLRLLAAYLRMADALHMDQSRALPEDYGLALTYYLPYQSKMHWIRSRLVLGVEIDAPHSRITVHLKYPQNLRPYFERKTKDEASIKSSIREFDEKISRVYSEFIVNSLKSELATVEKVLIENNITSYINVQHVVHTIFFDHGFLKEIVSIAKADLAIRRPSSTALYSGIISTVIDLLSRYEECWETIKGEGKNPDSSEIVDEFCKKILMFVNEMLAIVENNKKCHFMVYALLIDLKRIVEKRNKPSMEAVYNEAEKCFELYKEGPAKIHATEHCGKYIRAMQGARQSVNVLCFILNYTKLLKYTTEYDHLLMRYNAHLYLSDIMANKHNEYVYWQLRAIINEHVERLLSEDVFDRIGREESRPFCMGSTDNDDDTKEGRIPARMGIMLYGYSSCVLHVLCGFRDYILERVFKALAQHYAEVSKEGTPPSPCNDMQAMKMLYGSRGLNILEKQISDSFEIYVCEGQPKNINESGHLRYHDGYEYIKALRKRNFHKVILVADAISGTLLTQYYEANNAKNERHFFLNEEKLCELNAELPCTAREKIPLFPRINFFMMGVNGFCDKYVYHSAGHLSHISSAVQKGRTNIVLVTQSKKYLREGYIKSRTNGNRSIHYEDGFITQHGGIKCYHTTREEHVKTTYFNQGMNDYFMSIDVENNGEIDPLLVYSPTEDAIRFLDIDSVISEYNYANIQDIIKAFQQRTYVHGPKMHVDRRKTMPPLSSIDGHCGTNKRTEGTSKEVTLGDFERFGGLLYEYLRRSKSENPSPSVTVAQPVTTRGEGSATAAEKSLIADVNDEAAGQVGPLQASGGSKTDVTGNEETK